MGIVISWGIGRRGLESISFFFNFIDLHKSGTRNRGQNHSSDLFCPLKLPLLWRSTAYYEKTDSWIFSLWLHSRNQKIILPKSVRALKITQKWLNTNVQHYLTRTLSAWLLRSHWALKSIFRETLFLDQLHDFWLLSLNSFLHPFLKSKFMLKKF